MIPRPHRQPSTADVDVRCSVRCVAAEIHVTQFRQGDLHSTLSLLSTEEGRAQEGSRADYVPVPPRYAALQPTPRLALFDLRTITGPARFPDRVGQVATTSHTQRRDALAVLVAGPSGGGDVHHAPVGHASQVAARVDPPHAPVGTMVHDRRDLHVNFGTGLVRITPLMRSFIAGLRSDAGANALLVLANPFLVIINGALMPGIVVQDHNINGGRIFYNAQRDALVIFLVSQEGGVFVCTRSVSEPQTHSQWVTCTVVLPVVTSPIAHKCSANDVAVLPYAGSQYLVAAVTDSENMIVALVDIDFEALRPVSPITRGAAPPYVDPATIVSVRFTTRLNLADGGLDGHLARFAPNEELHGDARAYFTYLEFSQCGKYLCASNDAGRFVAVWSVELLLPDPDTEQPPSVTLTLDWVLYLPVGGAVSSEQPDAKRYPYRVVQMAGSVMAVIAGDLVFALDAQAKVWDVARPLCWTGSARQDETSFHGELIGADSLPFGATQLLVTSERRISRLSLSAATAKRQELATSSGCGNTLKEICLAFIRDRASNFGDLDTLRLVGLKCDAFARFCPYGHKIARLDPPALPSALANHGALGIPLTSVLRCLWCRQADSAIALLCHSCGYALCHDCCDRRLACNRGTLEYSP